MVLLGRKLRLLDLRKRKIKNKNGFNRLSIRFVKAARCDPFGVGGIVDLHNTFSALVLLGCGYLYPGFGSVGDHVSPFGQYIFGSASCRA